ncbi:MAG: polyphosphate polymerase domain-containing protein [Eubacteriales bacterium]|nr:polyphosphate polymerase domain-containing protein [Eubacteriales bacterium]
MSQEIFKRIEKKYLMNEAQFEAVRKAVREHMVPDKFANYSISNIYFDTEDYWMIRNSLEQPEYKEKIRLRSYGAAKDDEKVFLELKKKYDGVVYKRRVTMTLKEARDYLINGIHPGFDSQILREIDYAMQQYKPVPAVHLSYDREAYAGKDAATAAGEIAAAGRAAAKAAAASDKDFRLTFDTNIRARQFAMDLKYPGFGEPVLPEGKVLMEVKIPGAMPLWFARVLSENRVYPESFSKYGRYYRDYIAPSMAQSRYQGGRIDHTDRTGCIAADTAMYTGGKEIA